MRHAPSFDDAQISHWLEHGPSMAVGCVGASGIAAYTEHPARKPVETARAALMLRYRRIVTISIGEGFTVDAVFVWDHHGWHVCCLTGEAGDDGSSYDTAAAVRCLSDVERLLCETVDALDYGGALDEVQA